MDDWRDWGGLGYCLTTVLDLAPSEVLARLDATALVSGLSLDQVENACWETWKLHDGRELFVGVTTCGPSALMVEHNGFVGVTTELAVALSRGTTVVSHHKNVNAVDRFLWIVDGAVRLDFEPLFPTRRTGSEAATVEPLLREVAFDLQGHSPRSTLPSVFALSAALSGVELTPADLDATYWGGVVALPT